MVLPTTPIRYDDYDYAEELYFVHEEDQPRGLSKKRLKGWRRVLQKWGFIVYARPSVISSYERSRARVRLNGVLSWVFLNGNEEVFDYIYSSSGGNES